MKKALLLSQLFIASLAFSSSLFAQQAPNLGSASGYAIFSAIGDIANTGSTVLNGSLGANNGTITGFPPGIVTGQIHIVDGTSLMVAADLLLAHTNLGLVTCDSALAPGLGNGQILLPKVYCISGAASITGNLTLDGGGDSDAVFIFKLDNAFSTASLSNVILTNGASFSNVYWRIAAGDVNLGTTSIFNGTILSDGGLIDLADGAVLNGRALVLNGAVTMLNNTVTVNAAVPLPVSLVNFSASRQGENALLKWTTVNKEVGQEFIAERSTSAREDSWKMIGSLPATEEKEYSMVDNQASAGLNYYRLRSMNANGSVTISNVKTVLFDEKRTDVVTAFPNPAKSSLTLNGVVAGSTLVVRDMMGNLVQMQVAGPENTERINTSGLTAGSYLLKINAPNGNGSFIKFIKE